MKRKQEAQEKAEAEERARREAEEAERRAQRMAEEAAAAAAADRPDAGPSATEEKTERGSPTDDDNVEGSLVRKHEWENTTTKASNRSWDKVYVMLRGIQLTFYRDAKTAHSSADQTFKGEAPLSLHNAKASRADDYKKKKHVFRLKLESGAEFLFHAQNDTEMNMWISKINSRAEADSAGPSRSQTLPASAQKEDSKRRSFFTLKKT